MRITGYADRGVLKFRIRRNGQVFGSLTLSGLVRWMEAQKKPTEATVSFTTSK